jgi:L,D-transpeptidase ErfK/SrfK
MKIRTLLACSFLMLSIGNIYAATYNLPMGGDTVVADYPNEDSHLITVTREDFPEVEASLPITLLDVAKRYHLGQEEIVRLNPAVDRWLVKPGEMVRIPNKRILPDTPRNGVTLNISEFRMYYYPPNTGQVRSFAHGIGRQDWKTPLGQTKIIRKIKNPVWNPPASIRREHAADGDPLPAVVPAGPHNPLGTRALYLALPGEYRIHGTDIDKVYGIGMQITHGCVRMYPEDIEELYDIIPVGTPVYIVKQPIKVGWLNNVLYLEAHPDLEGENMGKERRYQLALNLIRKANGNQELPEFDQKALNDALEKLDGEPLALFERLPPLEGSVEAVPTMPPTISTDPIPAEPSEPVVTPPPEPQTKLAPKFTPKPVVKGETKVAAKPAPKTTVKVAAKPAPKTEVKVAAKPVSKTAVKVAEKTAPKTSVKVAAKPAPKTEVKVAVKPVPKAVVKPAPKTDVKVAAKPVPKPVVKVAAKPAPKSGAKVVAKPVAKPETKVLPKTAAKFVPKPLASL